VFTGPGRLQRAQGLGGEPGPFCHGDTEHVELPLHVPVGEHDIDAAAAQQIEHGEVLGQTQRVMEGSDQG